MSANDTKPRQDDKLLPSVDQPTKKALQCGEAGIAHDLRDAYVAAMDRYWQELPSLLDQKPGRWVAYTAQGLLADGADADTVHRICDDLCAAGQLKRGHFLVTRVEPDLSPAEITENWYPLAD